MVAPTTSNAATTNSAVMIGSKPTLIVKDKMRFLIMDAPRQSNLHLYIKEMRRHSVTDVVRVCEPTYHGQELTRAGIALHEMAYPDGHSPPNPLILDWLQLVERTFYTTNSSTTTAAATSGGNNDQQQQQQQQACIAVHCVAGLGRAPVLVALALIEFANMDPVEAVSMIRAQRRGSINEKQLLYLEGYKKQMKRRGGAGADTGCSCVLL